MEVRQTFFQRSFSEYLTQAGGAYEISKNWYLSTRAMVKQVNNRLLAWMRNRRWPIIISLAATVAVIIVGLFISDLNSGAIDDPVRVGAGGMLGTPVISALGGLVLAVLIYIGLWVFDKLTILLIAGALFAPVAVLAAIYGLYLIVLVALQLVALLVLSVLLLTNGLWLLSRHIFYTCPDRTCAERGLPIHVCPRCGRHHRRLWPNLYGLLYHSCAGCGRKLPALDLLGRDKLLRLCANPRCGTRLAKQAGKRPEELVALVGGAGAGKTSFMLASLRLLLDGLPQQRLKGALVDVMQRDQLQQELKNLTLGLPPDKTNVALTHAYLIELTRGARASLLYYYDAAGELFGSIEQFGRHENVRHLNGIILLIDPFSLEGVGDLAGRKTPITAPLEDVLAALVGTVRRMRGGRERISSIPLAVVITKADDPAVRAELGDLARQLPSSEQCRRALEHWGAGNELRLLQQNFRRITFFACSALGRSPYAGDQRPFESYGILEPLLWILKA